jgi:hypothetical protein
MEEWWSATANYTVEERWSAAANNALEVSRLVPAGLS